jgi:hypothetical protein
VSSDWCHRTQQSGFSIRFQNVFVWLSSGTYGVLSITPCGGHIIMVPLIEDHMSSAKSVPANILDIKAKQTCKKYGTLPTDLLMSAHSDNALRITHKSHNSESQTASISTSSLISLCTEKYT